MSFDIVLHNCTDPVNKINKTINENTLTGTYSGQLVEGTSLVDPNILIESETVPAGNYAYISAFGRYYYITDIVSEKTNLWRLTMHSDPLKSFASQICANTAVIARSSSDWNLYLEDTQYKAYANPKKIVKTFPSGFSTFKFVLALMGGHT